MALKEKDQLKADQPEQSAQSAQQSVESQPAPTIETEQAAETRRKKALNTLHKKAAPAIGWAKRKPQTAVLGQFFYDVGFWGEYTAFRTVRRIKKGIVGVATRILNVLKKIGGYIGGALLTGLREITAPFTRFARGIKNIAIYMGEERKKGGIGRALVSGICYLFRGIRLYAPLLRQSFAYVLPLFALALLVHTVQTVLNYNYILAVEVNGTVVGYVESEQVFDSAQTELTQRIYTVGDEERKWEISPTYSLDVSNTLMNETQMADAILLNSSQEIQEATALYIDGGLVAVTTEGSRLQGVLNGMKAPYEEPDNENLRVEFNKDVELVDGIYFTDSLSEFETITETLEGDEQGQIDYITQKGDSPSGIASAYGLSTAQLAAMNPQQDILKSLHIGDTLLISRAQPFLEVRRIETVTYEKEIPFSTKRENSSDMAWGSSKISQQGENGMHQITEERVYYGDSQVQNETHEIDRITLKEPVTKIILEGTKLSNGMLAQTGSGSLLWPVPNYKYVSRWMGRGHKGADICAAYGTPVYAADSGVVITAGWHYSYGNYIVIDHGNGFRTLYAHNSALLVGYGQAVTQGQKIAQVGSTGNSSGNHVHLEVFVNGVRRSAREWFPGY